MLGDTQRELEGKSRVEDDHISLYIYMKFSRIKTSIKKAKYHKHSHTPNNNRRNVFFSLMTHFTSVTDL